VQRIALGDVQRDQRMTRLVVGRELLSSSVMAIERRSVPISHLVLGVFEVGHVTRRLPTRAARNAASFTRIGEVGAGEARRAAGQHVRIDVGRQRQPCAYGP